MSSGARPCFFSQFGELGRGGRLARAVEADHQDARGLVEIQRRGVAAEQAVSSSWKILTICWPGVTRAQHLLAQRLLLHPGDETLRDLEIDIRLEQRHPHLAHRVGDVRLR